MKSLLYGLSVADVFTVACVLLCLGALAMFPERAFNLVLCISALLIARTRKHSFPALAAADYATFALLLTYSVHLVQAHAANAFPRLISMVSGIGIYWLLRLAQAKLRVQQCVFIGVAAGVSVLSCAAVVQTASWVNNLERVGFVNVSPFKATIMSVLGGPINEWATVAVQGVVFSAFCLYPERPVTDWRNVVALSGISLASLSLWLTLSRGAYLAIGTFLVIMWLVALLQFGTAKKLLIVSAAGVLLSAVIAGAVSHGAVITTIGGSVTEQQRRSTSNRLDLWASSLRLARQKPVLGTGPGTFAVQYIPYAHLGEYRPFVGRPLNTPLGIFVEEGVLGLLCYGLLIIALFWRSVNSTISGRSFAGALLCAGLAALLVREMTFSSYLECPVVSMLFWVMAAAIVNLGDAQRTCCQ